MYGMSSQLDGVHLGYIRVYRVKKHTLDTV